jgi:hypothetical protein
MRRRSNRGRNLLADEVLAIGDAAQHEHRTASVEVRNHAVRQVLADAGYTPLDYMRARYWLRRGKPAGYRWDAW